MFVIWVQCKPQVARLLRECGGGAGKNALSYIDFNLLDMYTISKVAEISQSWLKCGANPGCILKNSFDAGEPVLSMPPMITCSDEARFTFYERRISCHKLRPRSLMVAFWNRILSSNVVLGLQILLSSDTVYSIII
jgi:hypothetical protein